MRSEDRSVAFKRLIDSITPTLWRYIKVESEQPLVLTVTGTDFEIVMEALATVGYAFRMEVTEGGLGVTFVETSPMDESHKSRRSKM